MCNYIQISDVYEHNLHKKRTSLLLPLKKSSDFLRPNCFGSNGARGTGSAGRVQTSISPFQAVKTP